MKIEEDDLDAIYARLTSPEPVAVAYPTPTSAGVNEKESRWRKASFSFDTPVKSIPKDNNKDGGVALAQPKTVSIDNSAANDEKAEMKSTTAAVKPAVETKHEVEPEDNQKIKSVVKQEPKEEVVVKAPLATEGLNKEELEHLYLQEAFEYLRSLAEVDDGDARLVWVVATKLRRVINPDPSGALTPSELDTMKKKIVDSVAKYVDEVARKKGVDQPLMNAEWIHTLLAKVDGSFLKLSAKLVKRQFIALDDLKEVTGLCEAIKAALSTKDDEDETAKKVSTSGRKLTPVVWNDPMEAMKAWPTQSKRDNSK